MKVGYLVIGRLKSTRLPKKILLQIEGRPYLAHMFDRLKLSKKTDVIVLCTSTNPEDDPLEICAKDNGVECFRGSEDDVVKRLYDAAVKYQLDYILTITADCPLVDWKYADKVAEAFAKTNADLITAMDLPHGAFTHGLKPAALKKILEIKDASDTEVWGRYFSDTGLFETYRMPITNLKYRRPDIRMTLDYPEDDQFFRAVFKALYKKGQVFGLDAIIDYLKGHPEVMAINKHCAQKYLSRYTRQSEIKLRQRFDVKKIVVFGSGSIGQRHIRNLKKLGYNDIMCFRTRKGHFQALPKELKVKEVFDWKDVLAFKPDAAIISNPTSLHLKTAMRLVPHVKGLLIEKPLSNTSAGIKEFLQAAQARPTVTFVGYNLQLHPIVKAIQAEMDKDYLGKPLIFQAQVGQWLPGWHPYEDYTKGYYANKDLGGGVTLTLIHEINLAQKLLGKASKVVAFFPPSGKLNLDVDTRADIMVYHQKDSVSQIHLDYIQQPNSRWGAICFETGWLRYDLVNPKLTVQTTGDKTPRVLWENKNYDMDAMYQEEVKIFLRYAGEGRLRHDFDAWRAAEDLHLVEAAFKSAQTAKITEIS
jgi:spore coat polysaccharide biosynthesis protein SpsF